ncbi:hypothetical protein JR316_0007507 [Psilocybe cubensis]|uniref:Uncharacterized protein n=3 Tax=Psilocybe cubensis TaxID=181762 RepID=A0ACB8GF02_PSICU|nr:uncharacterized protein JR316_0013501 [Psilocybe cubensis]XP_047743783.1 hypothetical protein JR316_0011729 [Psilocybe cubensis]XP_047748530.1 hypothetical protein JR316_0007507 [Psilocybe cubensis]KAH9474228.1 hypothetical protein JR316_0013501 [Psilocybe cubensis]KAH9476158.1 hypothetical protein JR316_0011729 [Psilocybe cubensis]KAH9480905.1 hypothetical protein JR316_0007507 [Psilocybe cubensis]
MDDVDVSRIMHEEARIEIAPPMHPGAAPLFPPIYHQEQLRQLEQLYFFSRRAAYCFIRPFHESQSHGQVNLRSKGEVVFEAASNYLKTTIDGMDTG